MRVARISITASLQLKDMLADGAQRFGADIADQTASRIDKAVHSLLLQFPHWFAKAHQRNLHIYAVPKTPVIIAYDFDDEELRVHFLFHRHADRTHINSMPTEW